MAIDQAWKRRFLNVSIVAGYLIHYLCNFLSSPMVSFTFLFISALTFIILLSEEMEYSFLVLIAFAFIEGQGRVLFSYNPLFRIMFDLLCALLVFKTMIKKRKLLDTASIPTVFLVFFVLHALWFTINLFNPTGASPLIAFAASKYYLLPFFLFFSIVNGKLFSNQDYIKKVGKVIVVLTFLTCLLCIYQILKGESSVHDMNPNYVSLFEKYEGFTGAFWRPWGTGHVAGSMSMYLTFTVGLVILYYSGKQKTKSYLAFSLIIVLSWVVLYFSQVRAFMIRHTLILIGLVFIQIFFSRTKKKIVIASVMSIILLTTIVSLVSPNIINEYSDANTQMATKRFLSLFDSNITKSRSSADLVFERIRTQTNWPFGYGPGMVTNFLPQIEERRNELVWLDKMFLWSGDNFLIFTFLELGIGAILYIGLFLLAPLILIFRLLKMDRVNHREEFKIAISCIIVLSVSILGNWGAVGLSFNPESFFYWMWTAIGLDATSVSLKLDKLKPSAEI